MRVRQRAIGTRRKLGMASHPDAGWNAGIALFWKESSRGIWVMRCAECRGFASPCPTAEHRFVLTYQREDKDDETAAVERARRTAAMLCPHCGALLTDAQRRAMVDAGRWMHRSQTLDPERGPVGEEQVFEAMGFWIHALMTKMVTVEQLAGEWETARRHHERSRKPQLIREFTAKTLGEVYEGGGKAAEISGAVLAKRAAESGFRRGTVPPGARFITAAVDPGKAKFDVGFWGWDLEGRSWLIDRVTLMHRFGPHGQQMTLRPAERIEDWTILREQVLNRVLPLAQDPGLKMPVAAMTVDTGGADAKNIEEGESGVTWKAREFARRMMRVGETWAGWPRVHLIKGAKSPNAPELPVSSREVNRDQQGKPIAPTVKEWDLGVHRLKMLSVERLAVTDMGPGQCHFAQGLDQSALDEFTGEVLIDGGWDRRGPNESLDLFGYAEAARQIVQPDRADIRWDTRPPVWATPVPIAPAEPELTTTTRHPAAPGAPTTALQRMAAMNRKR